VHNVNSSKKTDIDTKIKGAEAYHSHGLYQESLEIYEQILSIVPKEDPARQKNIREIIALIKKEIKDLEQDDPALSSQDISQIKATWAGEENVSGILDSASAFKELGLFKEAIEEYTKLFKHDYPQAKIIPDLAECLFKIHSPSRVIDQIEKIIHENDLSDQEKAEIKFAFGMEMEKQDYKDLAFEFYESVKAIDPEFEGIQTQIDLIQRDRSYDSKYSYLLESNMVNAGQLQNVLAQSKQANRSVEYILMENLRIDKAEIGKSLSLFYKVPFKTFDPEIPIPYELLAKLKKTFLLQNNWVPLGWEMTTRAVDILIDDPTDLMKTDNITTLIKTKKSTLTLELKRI